MALSLAVFAIVKISPIDRGEREREREAIAWTGKLKRGELTTEEESRIERRGGERRKLLLVGCVTSLQLLFNCQGEKCMQCVIAVVLRNIGRRHMNAIFRLWLQSLL